MGGGVKLFLLDRAIKEKRGVFRMYTAKGGPGARVGGSLNRKRKKAVSTS